MWLLHPDACSEEKYQGLLAKAIEDKKRADEEKEALELAQRLAKAEQERKDLELEKLRAENEKLKRAKVISSLDPASPDLDSICERISHPSSFLRISEIYKKYPTEEMKAQRIIELEDELNDLQITSSTYISGDLF